MTVKKFIFQLHKILGLTTGTVVFIIAITGCCWVFKDEIEGFYDDYKKVTPEDAPILTATRAKEVAMQLYPNNTVHGTVFKKADDAIEVIFYDAEPEFYKSVFLNPYSGEVIKVKDHLSGFFAFVLKGHMRLWLPKKIGEQVVGISVLLFILIIISGIFIWIPKKRKYLKQRLKFDWKKTTKWKRKNFDLHTVVGLYICSLALILAFTGSTISYDWFKKGIYKSIGGNNETTFVIPENLSLTQTEGDLKPIDLLVVKMISELPEAKELEVHYPNSESQSIYVEVSKTDGIYYDSDYLFFDQNTLEPLKTPSIYGKYADAPVADKIIRMNYDIHVGAIGGLPGKFIAFFASLLIASLPVTGTLLWYGRTYKKKKTSGKLRIA